jgi:hypothetical protein
MMSQKIIVVDDEAKIVKLVHSEARLCRGDRHEGLRRWRSFDTNDLIWLSSI